MTLNEFLKKLEETPRRWKLEKSWRGAEAITDQKERCPLESLGGKGLKYTKRLGMYSPTCMRIIHAADGAMSFADYDPKLRVRLLKACGLS